MFDSLFEFLIEGLFYGTGEVLLRVIPQRKFVSELRLTGKPAAKPKLRRAGRRKRDTSGRVYYEKVRDAPADQGSRDFNWKRLPDGTVVLGLRVVALLGFTFWVLVVVGVIVFRS